MDLAVVRPRPGEDSRLLPRILLSALALLRPGDLRGTRPDQSRGSERDRGEYDALVHFCLPAAFIFDWYSGYIVSAPPSAASTGILRRSANSCRNGFSPGRK